ncbi:MAG: hypothetical protein ACI9MR_001734 [Myxococcota bacterium]
MRCCADADPTVVVGRCGATDFVDGSCDDGDLCTTDEVCVAGDCGGSSATCDDANPCTNDSCDPSTGACVHTPADALCDDGLMCNGAEICDTVAGCVAGAPPTCDDGVACTLEGCNETVGCYNLAVRGECDDGSFCNGVETCDAALGCQAAPVDACDDDVPCTVDVCDETGDSCTNTPDHTTCDDGVFCTGVERCDPVFNCVTEPVNCLDDVACTRSGCDPVSDSCVVIADDAECDDGRFCNGAETCDAVNGCQPGAAVTCETTVACGIAGCDENSDACSVIADHEVCADGSYCNGIEVCDVVQGCLPGGPTTCDDGNLCTQDLCDDGAGGCAFAPITCDDNKACTVDTCNPAVGCVFTELCPTSSEMCTVSGCNDAGDCEVRPASGTVCNDGNACTIGDVCQAGVCLAGPHNALAFDLRFDQDGFTVDDDGENLVPDFSREGKNAIWEGDPSVGTFVVGRMGGKALHKGAGSERLVISNLPTTQLTFTVMAWVRGETAAVSVFERLTNDGSAGVSYLDGVVRFGTTVICRPELVPGAWSHIGVIYHGAAVSCWLDGVQIASAAVPLVTHADSVRLFGPGDVTTIDTFELYIPGLSGGGIVRRSQDGVFACIGCLAPGSCDDGNPCTSDRCDGQLGCVHLPLSVSCDDGNPCTVGDVCDQGACVGLLPASCDDGNACTNDRCDVDGGCTYTVVGDQQVCDDENFLTLDDVCVSGVCRPTATALEQVLFLNFAGSLADQSGFGHDGAWLEQAAEYVDVDDFFQGPAVRFEGAAPRVGMAVVPRAVGGTQPFTFSAWVHRAQTGDGQALGTSALTLSGADELVRIGATTIVVGGTSIPFTPVGWTHVAMAYDGSVARLYLDGSEVAQVPAPTGFASEAAVATVAFGASFDGWLDEVRYHARDIGNAAITDYAALGYAIDLCDAVDCDDDNPCTADGCDPVIGVCTHDGEVLEGQACAADLCLPARCLAGVCTLAPGQTVCDDNNPCTEDICSGSEGCIYVPVSCEDGDPCTEASCNTDSGQCVYTPACDDGDVCTADSCNADGTCVHTDLSDVECEDGNACTVSDTCTAGACESGPPADCDDADVCTVDTCDTVRGCVLTPLCADGDACTDDVCTAGACSFPTFEAGRCDDDDVCTIDSCDMAVGCVNVADPCDDDNPCTLDTCAPGVGCAHTPLTPAQVLEECGYGICTTAACDPARGECTFEVDRRCDDDNPCTEDLCLPFGACEHRPVLCVSPSPCAQGVCDPVEGGCVYDLPDGCGNGAQAQGLFSAGAAGDDVPVDENGVRQYECIVVDGPRLELHCIKTFPIVLYATTTWEATPDGVVSRGDTITRGSDDTDDGGVSGGIGFDAHYIKVTDSPPGVSGTLAAFPFAVGGWFGAPNGDDVSFAMAVDPAQIVLSLAKGSELLPFYDKVPLRADGTYWIASATTSGTIDVGDATMGPDTVKQHHVIVVVDDDNLGLYFRLGYAAMQVLTGGILESGAFGFSLRGDSWVVTPEVPLWRGGPASNTFLPEVDCHFYAAAEVSLAKLTKGQVPLDIEGEVCIDLDVKDDGILLIDDLGGLLDDALSIPGFSGNHNGIDTDFAILVNGAVELGIPVIADILEMKLAAATLLVSNPSSADAAIASPGLYFSGTTKNPFENVPVLNDLLAFATESNLVSSADIQVRGFYEDPHSWGIEFDAEVVMGGFSAQEMHFSLTPENIQIEGMVDTIFSHVAMGGILNWDGTFEVTGESVFNPIGFTIAADATFRRSDFKCVKGSQSFDSVRACPAGYTKVPTSTRMAMTADGMASLLGVEVATHMDISSSGAVSFDGSLTVGPWSFGDVPGLDKLCGDWKDAIGGFLGALGDFFGDVLGKIDVDINKGAAEDWFNSACDNINSYRLPASASLTIGGDRYPGGYYTMFVEVGGEIDWAGKKHGFRNRISSGFQSPTVCLKFPDPFGTHCVNL